MTMIVENGTGVLKANSYVGLAYAQTYLQDRGKNVVPWSTASKAQREQALIKATDYIDKRFALKFIGDLLYTEMAVPGKNMLILTALPAEDDTITFNTTTYTFKASSGGPTEIAIGGSTDACAFNIMSMASSQTDMVFSVLGSVVYMESAQAGEFSYPTSSDSDGIEFDSPVLTGGSTSSGQQPLCFPRTMFSGIPEVLKMATVEYAVRSMTDDLMPDPVFDETNQPIRRKLEKVGPIEEEIVYQVISGIHFRVYPDADALLRTLINENSGVYR
jgi:hypothetical protein